MTKTGRCEICQRQRTTEVVRDDWTTRNEQHEVCSECREEA